MGWRFRRIGVKRAPLFQLEVLIARNHMKTILTAATAVVLTLAAVFAVKALSTVRQPDSEMATTAGSTTRPKQLWTCGMHPQVIQDHPGFCPICHMKLVPLKSDSDDDAATAPNAKRKILYYWDPMLGPSSIAHAPGKSAMGMDLVPVYEDEQSGGPTVRIDPTIVQNMGVRTAEVSRGPLKKTIRAVGMLEVPEDADHEINLKVNGWITKLYANKEGMHVHKGDPLFDLYSPDLKVAEEELIGAVKSLKALDANASDALRAQAEDMVDSAKQKLRLWDVADEDITALSNANKAPDTVPFRDPANGHVMDKMVVEGSAVQAGMKIMRIEDHTKLWLDARVYEDDMSQIALGQRMEIEVDAQPGKTYTGPIIFIYPHVDVTTRTVLVRVTLDNPNHELSPGMFATANITTKPVSDAVLVPREAIIDTGTRQIAFVVMGQGHFEPRKVRMGMLGDDDRVQILEGLAPGETVVTSGQFLLDVESRTTEAIDKLRQSGGMNP
jgi:Cu(I)/Ag(I) efflux system membrane fusion protein/cobalt-zinc-cadmium efflux system membrane fusion protein